MESLVSINLLVKDPHLAISSHPQTSTKSPNAMGGDAGRRVVHMGELVAQLEQACRYYMWVSRASFYIMSRPRALVTRLVALKTFNKLTRTFCPPFQRQFPRQQPIPYRFNLQVPRWSRPPCLPTWTPLDTSPPGPIAMGVSQAETVPERWQTTHGPRADDELGEAGRLRQQPAHPISSFVLEAPPPIP